jgi:hypothetical protein
MLKAARNLQVETSVMRPPKKCGGRLVNGDGCGPWVLEKAMLIGAAGTIAMNLLFGVASFAGMAPPPVNQPARKTD